VGWRSAQAEIVKLQDDIRANAADANTAGELISRTTFARGWFDRRCNLLDGLREVALAFPDSRVWATSFAAHDDIHTGGDGRTVEEMRVTLTGKASGYGDAGALMDRLKASRRLTDFSSPSIQTSGGGSSEVSFSISFILKGAP
jgi:hypothetical protein